MCQRCGCTPCNTCGRPIEDGVCSGCGEIPGECYCDPEEQVEESEELEEEEEEEGEEFEDLEEEEEYE